MRKTFNLIKKKTISTAGITLQLNTFSVQLLHTEPAEKACGMVSLDLPLLKMVKLQLLKRKFKIFINFDL